MFDLFGFFRVGSRREESHYEQQMKWQINLEGKTSLEKIVEVCPKTLKDPPKAIPAPELTDKQKTHLAKCKEDQDMYQHWIKINGIPPLSGGWRIKE